MTAATVYNPTASQFASATSHLERRSEWSIVRLDGVRYVVLISGRSNRCYFVRADAAACGCIWSQTMNTPCSHRIAVELAALEDELREVAAEQPVGAATVKKAMRLYADLFPACAGGCGDVADSKDGLCNRCASDREWAARRDVAGAR